MNRSPLPPDGSVAAGAGSGRLYFRAYIALTALFWAGIVAQAFFAGAGMFAGGAWLQTHNILGHCLTSPVPLVPLVLIVLSFAAKLPGRDKQLAGWLFLFAMLQPVWLYLRGINPIIGALHPVNALLLFALPLAMMTRHGAAPNGQGQPQRPLPNGID